MADDPSIEKRLVELENRVTGVEIALSEVVLYAHDLAGKGVFNKDQLVLRLVKLLNRIPRIYKNSIVEQQVSIPIARLAVSLKQAGPIDEEGNPVKAEQKNDS